VADIIAPEEITESWKEETPKDNLPIFPWRFEKRELPGERYIREPTGNSFVFDENVRIVGPFAPFFWPDFGRRNIFRISNNNCGGAYWGSARSNAQIARQIERTVSLRPCETWRQCHLSRQRSLGFALSYFTEAMAPDPVDTVKDPQARFQMTRTGFGQIWKYSFSYDFCWLSIIPRIQKKYL